MSLQEIYQQFEEGMKDTSWLEYIAVFAGIASVWFSRRENILVYPVGLVNTIIYIYLSFKYHLLGEASVNLYYTIMSIYGWMLWTRKNKEDKHTVIITTSSWKDWRHQLSFFAFFYISHIHFTSLPEKRICSRSHSLGRCTGFGNCIYRHVVDGPQKS